MSLLFADSCMGQEGLLAYGRFDQGSYTTTTRFGTGRSILCNNSITAIRKVIVASTDVYVGYAWMQNSLANALTVLQILGDSGATSHLSLVVLTTGGIEFRRGSTVLGSVPAGTVQINVWNYFEVHVRVHGSTGIYEVRLNGNPTPIFTFTGNTKNGGTANSIDAVQWGGVNGTNGYVMDIYVCDGLGGANDSYLGDVRCQLLQVTGAGSSTGLTPSTGSNYQTVDEIPASATDYSGSAVSGARDTYAISDLLTGSGSVKGVRHTVFWHKSDAGAATMKHAMRVGGSNYAGTAQSLPSSMAMHDEYYNINPITSLPFTVSEVNGMEIGAEVG